MYAERLPELLILITRKTNAETIRIPAFAFLFLYLHVIRMLPFATFALPSP